MESEFQVVNNRRGLYGGRSFSCSGCDPTTRGDAREGSDSLTCAVRYGFMGYIGEFRYSAKALEGCGGRVVVQTDRGIEIGERVSLTCTGCSRSVSRQQMETYTRTSGTDFCQPRAGRVLRAATAPDLQEEAKINADAELKLEYARSLAQTHNLDMRFVACEHLFGGERIIFHFMAEDRVDFRDLVRDLAHEYRTRIEMHQIGARDEARLVADYEICGRECCCRNFLKKLRPVTMRMAKLQKATLDPSKVSGRCGRLRCCLRYEHEGYEELNAKLPRTGARVRTAGGVGTIKDRHVLTQLLMIEYDDTGNFETVGLEAILETGLPKKPPMPPDSGTTPARGPGGDVRRSMPRPPPRPRRTEATGKAEEYGPAFAGEVEEESPAEFPTKGETPSAAAAAPGRIGVGPEAASAPAAERPASPRERAAENGGRHGRRRRRRGRGQQGGPPGPRDAAGASGSPPMPPAGPSGRHEGERQAPPDRPNNGPIPGAD